MRIVFSNHAEVCHIWANQNQSNGRAGNIFFEDKIIYSYGMHFPIAKFAQTPKGTKFVLFNHDDYSISTSQHKNHVSGAIDTSTYNIITCPSDLWGDMESVLCWFESQIEDQYLKAGRARIRGQSYINQAENHIADYNWLCDQYTINRPLPEMNVESIKAKIKKQKKDFDKRQAELKAKENELFELITPHWKAHCNHLELTQIKLNAGFEGVRAKQIKPNGSYLLRLSKDGKTIETSGQAKVPVRVINDILPLVEMHKSKNSERDYNIRVGNYTLNKIYQDGSIKVGCHFIDYDEISYIADLLK